MQLHACADTKTYGAFGRASCTIRIPVRCCAAPATAASALSSSPFASVSSSRGFLPAQDPCARLVLGSGAAEYEAVLADLSKFYVAGSQTLRRAILSLPTFPSVDQISCNQEEAPEGASTQLWRAYLVLSFLSHAYMWCDPGSPPPTVLPARLAVPWTAMSRAIGMPPVLVYATYNLLNWRRLDPLGPVALGNIACLHNFAGGMDEEWFRLAHVEIEANAAGAVAAAPALQRAVVQGDTEGMLGGLALMRDTLASMQASLSRMGEKCDPYVYYNRVRHPMGGWRSNPALPNGLIYEGVSTEPVKLYGETGAQSSIVPVFDAVLGIRHEQGWLRDYLTTMIEHMPPHHRAYIAALHTEPGSQRDMWAYVQSQGSPILKDAYNDVINELEKFRSQHKAFAFNYIAKFAKQQQQEKGTGGSDFMPALGAYRDMTAKHAL